MFFWIENAGSHQDSLSILTRIIERIQSRFYQVLVKIWNIRVIYNNMAESNQVSWLVRKLKFSRSILYVFLSLLFSLENPAKILSRNLITPSRIPSEILQDLIRNYFSIRNYRNYVKIQIKNSRKLLRILLRFRFISCANLWNSVATHFLQNFIISSENNSEALQDPSGSANDLQRKHQRSSLGWPYLKKESPMTRILLGFYLHYEPYLWAKYEFRHSVTIGWICSWAKCMFI
jgi:hypothetical protein